MVTHRHVHVNQAPKTPQFWLIWMVLCLNVTAGIAVISMASPMLQDVFGTHLLANNGEGMTAVAQKAAIVAAAAGLVGLISLFNSLGRIFWAWASDYIGRKNTYYTFFILGIVLYVLLPTWGHLVIPVLFVLSICIILTMYGGGFSTVPAYLADIFGTQMVGAIHGRLITAWSVAGVARAGVDRQHPEYQLDHGVAHNHVYRPHAVHHGGAAVRRTDLQRLVRPVAGTPSHERRGTGDERSLQREARTVRGWREEGRARQLRHRRGAGLEQASASRS